MLLALRKFNKDILHPTLRQSENESTIVCNEFACAMQTYGLSVQNEHVQHSHMELTEVTVQDEREMPFLTWGTCAYMFIM